MGNLVCSLIQPLQTCTCPGHLYVLVAIQTQVVLSVRVAKAQKAALAYVSLLLVS